MKLALFYKYRANLFILDIDNVIIKMKNVKPVMLSVSEWGALRPLWNDETVEGLDLER